MTEYSSQPVAFKPNPDEIELLFTKIERVETLIHTISDDELRNNITSKFTSLKKVLWDFLTPISDIQQAGGIIREFQMLGKYLLELKPKIDKKLPVFRLFIEMLVQLSATWKGFQFYGDEKEKND